jgi:hypothetical protein
MSDIRCTRDRPPRHSAGVGSGLSQIRARIWRPSPDGKHQRHRALLIGMGARQRIAVAVHRSTNMPKSPPPTWSCSRQSTARTARRAGRCPRNPSCPSGPAHFSRVILDRGCPSLSLAPQAHLRLAPAHPAEGDPSVVAGLAGPWPRLRSRYVRRRSWRASP